MPPIEDQRRLPSRNRGRAHSRSLITNSFVTPSPNVGPAAHKPTANRALRRRSIDQEENVLRRRISAFTGAVEVGDFVKVRMPAVRGGDVA
jgi:hypothetical protein